MTSHRYSLHSTPKLKQQSFSKSRNLTQTLDYWFCSFLSHVFVLKVCIDFHHMFDISNLLEVIEMQSYIECVILFAMFKIFTSKWDHEFPNCSFCYTWLENINSASDKYQIMVLHFVCLCLSVLANWRIWTVFFFNILFISLMFQYYFIYLLFDDFAFQWEIIPI